MNTHSVTLLLIAACRDFYEQNSFRLLFEEWWMGRDMRVFFIFILFIYFYFICYSKVQPTLILLLSQSIQAQTDYTPKHTCNSTITSKLYLLLFYKCYSKTKKLIIFVKEDN